ncbi:MAG: hypothetical protein ACRC9X_03480 [Bacteroidales bacterium]
MANLRSIKKDIEFLIDEIITDCYLFSSFHQGKKEEEVSALLLETVNLRNQLFERINSAPKEKSKQHFQTIRKDLLEGADKLFKQVSELSK